MTLLTVVAAPKPFGKNAHIDMIQRNCIIACKNLAPEVEFVLVGYEEGIENTANELGVKCYTNVRTTPQGTPLVSSIFELARSVNNSPLLSIINADNLIFPDYLRLAQALLLHEDKFLACGERWNFNITSDVQVGEDWQGKLKEKLIHEGKRSSLEFAMDYFIFPRQCFIEIPDFAIGRSGWDNWMVYTARKKGWKVIDVSEAIVVGHENHDYSHLPGGKPPYRLPETLENIRLAGGKYHLFLRHDVNWIMDKNLNLSRPKMTWKRFWREFEIFPLIHLHSDFLHKIHYALVRPRKAWQDFKEWCVKILRKWGLKSTSTSGE